MVLERLDGSPPDGGLLSNTRSVIKEELGFHDWIAATNAGEIEVITRILVRLTTEEEVELNNWEVKVETRGDIVRRDLLEVGLVLNNKLRARRLGDLVTLRRLEVDVRALKRALKVIVGDWYVTLGVENDEVLARLDNARVEVGPLDPELDVVVGRRNKRERKGGVLGEVPWKGNV